MCWKGNHGRVGREERGEGCVGKGNRRVGKEERGEGCEGKRNGGMGGWKGRGEKKDVEESGE